MSGLREISAVFAAPAGLDAKETAPLHFFAPPMLKMNSAALRNKVKERLMIERLKLNEVHRGLAVVNPKSEIPNSIDPLICLRDKDGQFFHHILRLADGAD